MTEQAKTSEYWLGEGIHEVSITQVEKQTRTNRENGKPEQVWRFTMMDDDWSRVYHSVIRKESTKTVLKSIAAVCGVTLSNAQDDDEILGLKSRPLRIRVLVENGFPRVVKWAPTVGD